MIHDPKNPADLSDHDLAREYEAMDADAGTDPRVEALIEEIERRNLDLWRMSSDGADERWPMSAADCALLGFAVPLKLFGTDGRSLRHAKTAPTTAVEAMAAQSRWSTGQALALERRHNRLLAAAHERRRALRQNPPSLERLARSALIGLRR